MQAAFLCTRSSGAQERVLRALRNTSRDATWGRLLGLMAELAVGRVIRESRLRAPPWWRFTGCRIDGSQFVTGFRVSRARFDRMVLEFGVSCGASEPLSADEELQFGEKLAITLYRLATGNFVRTIADHFEVSEASVTRYTRAVCQCICNRYAPLAQLARQRNSAVGTLSVGVPHAVVESSMDSRGSEGRLTAHISFYVMRPRCSTTLFRT